MKDLVDQSAPDRWEALTLAEIAQLRALLAMVRTGPEGKSLELRTSRARLALMADGTIRIEGRAVVQIADETITLDSATIHLN
ncbi:hypothetical protein [Roseinatronobacter alkalisoli]|uniref:Uncharacterized protein n=1 Tax=Roseinatronobacter alkalisoli TaxID=3028235 RepID=A0ABT5TF40_9RHOB|nr:hypothetical protein [Roseinatronobacter sp. HJB301]MDD7973734.1 hypothetical protein [Roseinatronobacter sp. HJB301]